MDQFILHITYCLLRSSLMEVKFTSHMCTVFCFCVLFHILHADSLLNIRQKHCDVILKFVVSCFE